MTAQHTLGKLMLWGKGDPSQVIAFESGPFMAQTIGGNDVPNARRLVACWNACDGLSTEALERLGTIDRARVGLDVIRSQAIAQRDELLAALQVVLRDYAAVHDVGDVEMQPAIYQANAAIQKATNKEQA